MKGLSRKKFRSRRRKFWQLAQVPYPKSRTVISTRLKKPFLFLLFALPDLNSRVRGHLMRANHGSICDSKSVDRAYDYFWLCVGAYSSVWSSAAWSGHPRF
jgi:hypothetical protein